MRRFSFLTVLLVPALLFLVSSGCKKKVDDDDPSDDVRVSSKKSKKVPDQPLKAEFDGTLRGQVIFDGDVPAPEPIADILKHGDKNHCLMGTESETTNQTWRVDKASKGVANAVIYLKPPKGKYFELTEAVRKPAKKIEELRQPHCAFIPHVLAVFPKYQDGAELKDTGQVLEIFNDAPISHNVKYEGDPQRNETFSAVVPPNTSKKVVFNPQNSPLNVSCQFHTWMSAKIFAFDNPFFAVTDSKGNFEIKNVPTGVPVTLVAWHEGKGGPFLTETKTFTKGDNPPLELKVSK